MKFGEILRRKRENKGMTQEEMAKMLGISTQNVCSYEKGYKIPPFRVIEAAADFFDCTLDEMVGRRYSAV